MAMLASPAAAATITSTDTFSTTALGSLGSVTLDEFDPTLGTLESVKITFEGMITGQTSVSRGSTGGPPSITVGGNVTREMGLDVSDQFGSDLVLSHVDSWSSSIARGGSDQHLISSSSTLDATTTALLAFFIGTGTLTFDLYGAVLNNLTYFPNATNSSTSITGFGSGTVTLLYTYTPFTQPGGGEPGEEEPGPGVVSEPALLTMLGLGLLASVRSRRRLRA
jgi:MYXO-CTERM domain-containing protein